VPIFLLLELLQASYPTKQHEQAYLKNQTRAKNKERDKNLEDINLKFKLSEQAKALI
jgi:hypothetical protein